MKYIYILIALFFSAHLAQAQYLESFVTPNKGILLGPCGTSDPNSCVSYDISGEAYWTLGGNLGGVDSEGLKTVSGALQFADVDELACFISPPINISSSPTSDLAVEVLFGGGWGSLDHGNVSYFVDGGAEVVIPNVTSCGGSANTFGNGSAVCDFADGTYTASAAGIVGDEITVMVCFDANATSEVANINFVSIPNPGTMVPVTWNKFNAKSMADGNLLEWSTASELNNERFEIERSIDNASNFQVISRQDGAGSTSEETFYSFLDEDVTPGTVYFYRIKQVDLDGKKSFSRLLSLQSANNVSFSISPNPFSHQITIDLSSDENQNIPKSFKLYNAQGVMIQEINTGTARQISVDMQEQAPGIYYISADNKDFKKIVKSH
ncbi:T9SS type A sorting domain-containing protein [Saprospiraceae bacterium]|nr:T9SS type A sorting domain-containing protein [Saprospiraceae bacterium]